ncbi:unnamed protein product [Meloidogyne enterolobii]|uniref:Uncharacterized protein n=1 Tax=Meloidogyne enterolobii TaxID=390850 RepID=A0ACB1AHK6_MELEN
MLETIKTSFLDFVKQFNFFCQLKADKEMLNLKDYFDKLFVSVDKFEYSLYKFVDELNLNRLIMEKFKMIESNGIFVNIVFN